MKGPTSSKLGSILFSTSCLVAFGLLADPVIKPASTPWAGFKLHEAANTEQAYGDVQVAAGKSIILDSSAKIVRIAVANAELAQTTAISEHEILVNAKRPGRTELTVWREDGTHNNFQLQIESEPAQTNVQLSGLGRQETKHVLTSAYQDAMARVQTAITGAAQ